MDRFGLDEEFLFNNKKGGGGGKFLVKEQNLSVSAVISTDVNGISRLN